MLEIIDTVPFSDATINSAMPYENYGDYHSIFLGKYMDHSVYRSLLKFEIPNSINGHHIMSAEIILYIVRNDYKDLNKEFRIYRVNESFNENSVNYSNQPSIETDIFQIFTVDHELNTFIKIDITELFFSWFKNDYPNHGILIKASDESNNSLVGFQSKDSEKPLYSPKLQINIQKLSKNTPQKNNIDTKDKISSLTTEECYLKGNYYFENSDFENACLYYNESFIEFSPSNKYSSKLLVRFIQTLDILGKYDDALDVLDRVLNNYTSFTELEYLRSNLYYKQEKITLAIRGYLKCIEVGESPIHLSFISGSGSYKSCFALAKIYYDLGDYEQSYTYSIKALNLNPKFTEPLLLVAEILIKLGGNINDVSCKMETILGANLDGKDYMTLADIFFSLDQYSSALKYFEEAERSMLNNSKINYFKGLCYLYMKQYENSYGCFERILEGDFYEDSIFKKVLCNILAGNMKEATKLLNMCKDPEQNYIRMVHLAFKNIVEKKDNFIISDDNNDSNKFLDIIFGLLNDVLKGATPEVFEKSLHLLNLIQNDTVLLRLGKLYYNNGLYKIAYDELVRSLTLFNLMDIEGLNMMKKILCKEGNYIL